MIRIEGCGAVYGELWYDEPQGGDCAVDIVLYRQRPAPIAAARCAPFLSLVSDLRVAEEAIPERFGKDCRYKIRRAEAKDALRMEFITDPEGRLAEFRAFFDAFARQKARPPCDPRWLLAACQARQLVLTSVWREAEALVWHGWVVSGVTAGLQYSGSCFRDRESDYRALVGRANRWLHWREMLRFKQIGIERYDWGGLFEDESTPERAGINSFKRDFGGRRELSYDCTVPVSLRGRIYLPLRDAWRRRKEGHNNGLE